MHHRTAALAATASLALALAAPAAASTRYVVRYGDTLTGIARAHGVGLSRLAHANHRPVFGILRAGEVLVIPGGRSAPHTYTVRWGDTLSGIGDRFGVGVGALARANGLHPSGLLLAGSTLRLPSGAGGPAGSGLGGRYRVRPGDTLSGIAARFGIGMHRLARHNHLEVNGILLAGITLRVPAGAAPAPLVTGPWSVAAAINRWSAHYGADAALARAVSWQESGFQAGVVSSAGAWGPMQVLPSTWRYVETVLIGHRVPHTADGNVRVGVAFLAHLLRQFEGDERLALAAYYRGPAAVRSSGVGPETRRYVANVLALRSRM